MGSQLSDWVTDNEKFSFEQACVFTPESLDPGSSSAVQKPLLLDPTLSIRGSGSRWSEALAELTKHAIPANIGGIWYVLVLDTGAETKKLASSPLTVSEQLAGIRDAFGFSTAALASVLRASRASVYNWLENEVPTDNFVQRIEQLNVIAADWQKMNSYHFSPGRLMKQKLGEDAAMLERLSREELDLAEIRAGMRGLLALMTKYRERMDRAKARAAKAPADTQDHREILERFTGSITTDR